MGLTTQGFIDELKRSLGNRTDISDERYVRWLNWAILDICGFHRKRTFRPVRFHELEDDFLFTVDIITATLSNATSNTVDLAGVNVSNTVDYYEDWVLTYDGQSYLIVAFDGTTATIAGSFSDIPTAGSTGTLHSRVYSIEDDLGYSPKENLWVIEKMKQVPDGESLEQVKWDDLVDTSYTSMGTPSQFARRGGNIIFDVTPDESLTYRVYVYNFPELLDITAMSVQSVLPDTYDEVIVLGAMWRGYEKLMEPERADKAMAHYLAEISNRREAVFMEDGSISKQIRPGGV